jgi:hypothetical protein
LSPVSKPSPFQLDLPRPLLLAPRLLIVAVDTEALQVGLVLRSAL